MLKEVGCLPDAMAIRALSSARVGSTALLCSRTEAPVLSEDDWKIAIEDARLRHGAVVNLIYFTDTQAMALLRLSVTIGIASASGAIAGLARDYLVPKPLGWALAAATMALAAGSWFCLRAMRTSKINLPGRGADFWLWAAGPEVNRENAFRVYLENLKEKHIDNNKLNIRNSFALRCAKIICGVVAPLAALAVGCAALWWSF